jgi:hypothetical protein
MSAYRVIDKLEIIVREGVWLPFGWRAVNGDQVLDLIEKLRTTLPDKTADARITSTATQIDAPPLDQAVAQAALVTEQSAQVRISDDVARAQAGADAIIADAQAAARDIRRGADEYADQVLASLDASLGKALAAVQKGRQALAEPASTNGKKSREMSPS